MSHREGYIPDSVERLCSQVDSSRLGFMLFRFGTRTHGLVEDMAASIVIRIIIIVRWKKWIWKWSFFAISTKFWCGGGLNFPIIGRLIANCSLHGAQHFPKGCDSKVIFLYFLFCGNLGLCFIFELLLGKNQSKL